jgi:TfoX N-terminal domain
VSATVSYDTELANRVRAQLTTDHQVDERKMFGGLAFLVQGHLALGVFGGGGLVVRVGREGMKRALSRPHTGLMVLGGRPRPGWVRVSPEGLRTTRQLSAWVRLGAGVARALPAGRGGAAPAPVTDEPTPSAIADFDGRSLWAALDRQRRARGLSWAGVATALWEQSAVLNGRGHRHPISPSTIAHMAKSGKVGCHHALSMLRWLGRPAADFVYAAEW